MDGQRIEEQHIARLVLGRLPDAAALLELLARDADAARAADEAQQILVPVAPHAEAARALQDSQPAVVDGHVPERQPAGDGVRAALDVDPVPVGSNDRRSAWGGRESARGSC